QVGVALMRAYSAGRNGIVNVNVEPSAVALGLTGEPPCLPWAPLTPRRSIRLRLLDDLVARVRIDCGICPQGLGGLCINDQLELGGLLDREIAWLRAFRILSRHRWRRRWVGPLRHRTASCSGRSTS